MKKCPFTHVSFRICPTLLFLVISSLTIEITSRALFCVSSLINILFAGIGVHCIAKLPDALLF